MNITVNAIVHWYNFGSDEQSAYREFCKTLRAKGLHKMSAFETNEGWTRTNIKPLDGKTIALETAYFFNDQWNTADGMRVFDWREPYDSSHDGHYGYWLELSPEATALRENTYKCGYCGKLHTEQGDGFCHDCLGNEYLTEKYLRLLRLVSVADDNHKYTRAELTEEERDWLKPLFIEAQTWGNNECDRNRLADLRKQLVNERDATIRNANAKHDGFMWLIDHGIKTSNVIYYDHTRRFCIGWRKELSADESKAMREALTDFSWPYDIK